MSRHLVGPDGLRVIPVQLDRHSEHWLFVRMREPEVQQGEIWYRVTRHGAAVGFPGYYQLDELQDIVDLGELHAPDGDADTGTA